MRASVIQRPPMTLNVLIGMSREESDLESPLLPVIGIRRIAPTATAAAKSQLRPLFE